MEWQVAGGQVGAPAGRLWGGRRRGGGRAGRGDVGARTAGAGRAGRCPGCAGRCPLPTGGGHPGLFPGRPQEGSAFALMPRGAAARSHPPPSRRACGAAQRSVLCSLRGVLRQPGTGPGSPACPPACPGSPACPRGPPPPPDGGRPGPRLPRAGAECGAVYLIGASPAGAGWGIRTSGLPAPASPGA